MGCAFLIGPCGRIPLEVNRLTTGPKVDTLARGRMGQAIGSKNVMRQGQDTFETCRT